MYIYIKDTGVLSCWDQCSCGEYFVERTWALSTIHK